MKDPPYDLRKKAGRSELVVVWHGRSFSQGTKNCSPYQTANFYVIKRSDRRVAEWEERFVPEEIV